MVSSIASLWVLTALGQAPAAPAEAAWLKAVPAETEVIVRVRRIVPVRDDLMTMIGAMSPAGADAAKPYLVQALDQQLDAIGKDALDPGSPVLLLFRLAKPGDSVEQTPFAALVASRDYAALQKALAGSNADKKPEPEPGGFDALTGDDGTPVFTFKGEGFVAVGSDRDLIAAIASPGKTFATTPDLHARLLDGDVGIYLDIAAIKARHGAQMSRTVRGVMSGIDQLGVRAGGLKAFKGLTRAMVLGPLDALKDADAVAMGVDFSAEGLDLHGSATVKPNSATAKALVGAIHRSAAAMGQLPSGLAFYTYVNLDSPLFMNFETAGVPFLDPASGTASPALQKAKNLLREADSQEAITATDMGAGGIRAITLRSYADPNKAVEAITALLTIAKSDKAISMEMIQDVAIEPKTERYKGFDLHRAGLTWNFGQLAANQPNLPRGADALKAMLGESKTVWYGTNGKAVLTIAAADWNEARALIDATLAGKETLGQSTAYRALRAKLPDPIGGLFIVQAQGLVRQVSARMSAVFPRNPALKVPAAMPGEPVFLGGSITSTPDGFRFREFIPSAVGPVFETGLVPILQGFVGKVSP